MNKIKAIRTTLLSMVILFFIFSIILYLPTKLVQPYEIDTREEKIGYIYYQRDGDEFFGRGEPIKIIGEYRGIKNGKVVVGDHEANITVWTARGSIDVLHPEIEIGDTIVVYGQSLNYNKDEFGQGTYDTYGHWEKIREARAYEIQVMQHEYLWLYSLTMAFIFSVIFWQFQNIVERLNEKDKGGE